MERRIRGSARLSSPEHNLPAHLGALPKLPSLLYSWRELTPPGPTMLQALKNLIAELSGETQEPRPFEAYDYRLAAAALLVHIASIDGDYDIAERDRIRHLVETRFGMSAEEASELLEAAYESEREAVDLYRFTSVLKRHLDEDGRRQVIGMLWDMAHADGEVHEFEENVVWRVAELLGVSTRERVALRRESREGGAPPVEGPWSPRKEKE